VFRLPDLDAGGVPGAAIYGPGRSPTAPRARDPAPVHAQRRGVGEGGARGTVTPLPGPGGGIYPASGDHTLVAYSPSPTPGNGWFWTVNGCPFSDFAASSLGDPASARTRVPRGRAVAAKGRAARRRALAAPGRVVGTVYEAALSIATKTPTRGNVRVKSARSRLFSAADDFESCGTARRAPPGDEDRRGGPPPAPRVQPRASGVPRRAAGPGGKGEGLDGPGVGGGVGGACVGRGAPF